MDKQVKDAVRLFDSPRGKYIIGQALFLAVRTLEKVKEPYKEVSNIQDMKTLQAIFFPYELVERAKKEMANGK